MRARFRIFRSAGVALTAIDGSLVPTEFSVTVMSYATPLTKPLSVQAFDGEVYFFSLVTEHFFA